MTAHLLICDDDARLRELLGARLQKQGFTVSTAADAAEARALWRVLVFDALILDVMLGDEDGLSLLESFRAECGLSTPVMMLSALNGVEDRIRGLRRQADDYLGKPFEPEELLLRLQALLRRVPEPTSAAPVIIAGKIYDAERGVLGVDDDIITLTPAENDLLRRLVGGEIIARDSGESRNVDAHIARLRKKLGDVGETAKLILTVRGKGYRLFTGGTAFSDSTTEGKGA